jgi:hypothetical protein
MNFTGYALCERPFIPGQGSPDNTRPTLGITQRVLGALSPEIKWSEREAGHSPSSSDDIKNAWVLPTLSLVHLFCEEFAHRQCNTSHFVPVRKMKNGTHMRIISQRINVVPSELYYLSEAVARLNGIQKFSPYLRENYIPTRGSAD